MHEGPSCKRGGIICIFFKSGKETIPNYRCKFPPLFKGSMKTLPPPSVPPYASSSPFGQYQAEPVN